MGEMADMMVNGLLDHETGEYIDGDEPGYPRTVKDAKPKKILTNYKNSKELNGIAKFLASRGANDTEAIDLIRGYCVQLLDFHGTLKECAVEIQKDFGQFVQYVNQNT